MLVLREGRPLRRWDRIVLEAALGSPKRQARLPPRRSTAVDGLVGYDAEQPRTEGRPGPEPAQRVVGLDEGLLRGVLGIGGPSGDHVGGPGGKVLVCPYELFVCGHVAISRPFDELLFLQWSAPHGEISLHVRPRVVEGSRTVGGGNPTPFGRESRAASLANPTVGWWYPLLPALVLRTAARA